MRLKLLFLLLFVLGFSVASLSCGGGKKPETSSDPLQAYFAELADIGNTFLDALAAQPQGLDRSAPIAQQIDVYETYARGLSDDIETARDDLLALTPPPEIADAHVALLAAVERARSVAASLEAQLGEINSSEELAQLSDDPDVASALQQFQLACASLRDIAVQNDIQTTVRCE